MIRYTYDYRAATVLAVECPVPGYPNRDCNGNVQFENTHFDNESDAWARLLSEAEAGQSLAVRRLVNAEAEMEASRAEVARAAKIRTLSERAHADYQELSARPVVERQGVEQ